MIIAVDFDGTLVQHRYPKIGDEIPFATETLKLLIEHRHKLILWTVREGKLLDEAVEWCRERGVEFYAINRDYPEENGDRHPNHKPCGERQRLRLPCRLHPQIRLQTNQRTKLQETSYKPMYRH